MNDARTVRRRHAAPPRRLASRGRQSGARAGFSLTEIAIASAIGGIVLLGTLTAFLWSARQASLASRISWSQAEAMRSSEKLTTYLRNASGIRAIDEVAGTWVEVEFTDGSVGRLVYSNSPAALRDGTLCLQKSGTNQVIVGRGVTAVMRPEGYTTPVFSRYGARTNALQVSYRVSESTRSGERAANDAGYAAGVSFVTCLRNAGD